MLEYWKCKRKNLKADTKCPNNEVQNVSFMKKKQAAVALGWSLKSETSVHHSKYRTSYHFLNLGKFVSTYRELKAIPTMLGSGCLRPGEQKFRDHG